MDINTEIFKRYAPSNKMRIVNNLSESELLAIRLTTLERIIKEAGTGDVSKLKRNHNKTLHIRSQYHPENKWNSSVDSICIYKGTLYINFYVQYSNTDTNIEDRLVNFLESGDYIGKVSYEDRYGNPQTSYFRYYPEDKARVIKAILKTYINVKYNYSE